MKKLFFCLLFSSVAHAQTHEVRMEKMMFTPAELRVHAGDTVIWKNYDKRGYHTVWFNKEGLQESDPLFNDESWQRTFDKAGTYPYICGPHPTMTGSIVVE